MSRWNIRPSAVIVLCSVFFLMLLIAVLPDVDLPDTAFHRGTAPVVVHTQATTAPLVVVVAAIFQASNLDTSAGSFRELQVPVLDSDPNLRPIFLRSIRC